MEALAEPSMVYTDYREFTDNVVVPVIVENIISICKRVSEGDMDASGAWLAWEEIGANGFVEQAGECDALNDSIRRTRRDDTKRLFDDAVRAVTLVPLDISKAALITANYQEKVRTTENAIKLYRDGNYSTSSFLNQLAYKI